MSRIQVDNIFDKEGAGAPTFPAGSVVTGVSTATSFSGNLTGGSITGTTATFSGNIDSVGLVTARSGVIASGIGLSVSEGGVRVTGFTTATSFSGDGSNLTGLEQRSWLFG